MNTATGSFVCHHIWIATVIFSKFFFYRNLDGHVRLSGVDGITVRVYSHDSHEGITRVIEIAVSNATANHVGKLECNYGTTTSSWRGSYVGSAWFATGTRLRMENTVFPKSLTYRMGLDFLRTSEDESLIPMGSDNVFQCIISTTEVPRNVSLYFQGRQLSVGEPFPPVLLTYFPQPNSQVYAHYFGQVTASDAGIYRWKAEFEDETIEKEINVQVAPDGKWKILL